MAKWITAQVPDGVEQKLQQLREGIDASAIPKKELDRNLVIAKWNLRAFGDFTRKWVSKEDDSPKRDLSSLLYISEILSTFDLSTTSLGKVHTLAVTDGNATVQAANGQVRYVAQDRYFVFLVNASYAYGAILEGMNALVVPRALYVASQLQARLDANTTYPLDDAAFYAENPSQAEMSEAVATVTAGNMSGVDAYQLLHYLLHNATGSLTSQAVDVTATVPLLNLPADALQIVPWEGVVNGPTGSLPATFWEKVGAAATALVNGMVALGQLIYGGLVALGNFFVVLGEAIVAWGMGLVGTVQAALQEVQAALEKVGEVLVAFTSYVLAWIGGLINDMIWPVLEPLVSLLDAYGDELESALAVAASEIQASGFLSEATILSVQNLLFGPLFLMAFGIAIAISIIMTAVMVATLGISLILTLAIGTLVTMVVSQFLNSPSMTDEPGPQYNSFVPESDVVDDARAYDAERRDPSSTEDPWALVALLLGGYLAVKYAYIAQIAKGEPTGSVAGALSFVLAFVGSIVGFTASKFEGDAKIRLGAVGLALSFLGIVFGVVSLVKFNPGSRLVALVGLVYSGVALCISGWALWAS